MVVQFKTAVGLPSPIPWFPSAYFLSLSDLEERKGHKRKKNCHLDFNFKQSDRFGLFLFRALHYIHARPNVSPTRHARGRHTSTVVKEYVCLKFFEKM